MDGDLPLRFERSDGLHVEEIMDPLFGDAQWYSVAIPYYARPRDVAAERERAWADTQPAEMQPCP